MKKQIITVFFLFTACGLFGQKKLSFSPAHLQCEYFYQPIGLDEAHPRLTWQLNDARKGAKQTAYQLVVGTDSIAVSKGKSLLWNTNKVTSDRMYIRYQGKTLIPFTRYFWKVILWDKDGQSASSPISSFETGMMQMQNWQGSWIDDGQNTDVKQAPYFRKPFPINKKIKEARAYIAVAGLYELYINGKKIGNHRLDPMYTRFDRRNLYVTYDVTKELKKGQNALGVLLGNGWYNHQSGAVWDFDKAPWRNRPTFCLDLRITYTDGSTEVISSDKEWKTADGPLRYNSIYTGEQYDARLEQKGWNDVNFDDRNWQLVSIRKAPSPLLVSQQVQPIRLVETLKPVAMQKFNDSTYVFDMGRNIAGVSEIKIVGEAGTILKLKHGERRYANGRVDLSNIDVYHRPKDSTDPFQTDVYILSGKGQEHFLPKFNYKGFRYVEVTSNQPIQLDKNSLLAYFTHSDVTPKGSIKSSNSLLDRLWWATNNAYLSNLMGYPTDCPQREKNGWTGDGHFAIETALYNFDGISVYEKWIADHRDEQRTDGVLPDIIPTGGWGYGTANGVDWTSTIAIIPWEIYQFYGDSKLLEDTYANIKSYVDYIKKRSPDDLTDWGRGDWVPVKSTSSLELTSSCYYYVDATILARTAKILGKEQDHVYYTSLAKNIKNAINKKYLNTTTGIYATGTQTELSVPLQWGVVPETQKKQVAKNLALKVEQAGFHLDVGVLGAKAILNALSENGYAETAYRVAVQNTYPSWGWWIENGATTLLENWDLDAKRDISDNHMMFGEIGAWFFKGLGGIKPDDEKPGFKHIQLRPHFIADLKAFEASHDSPYGKIVSKWKSEGDQINYEVVIPANTTATLYVPENVEADRIMELEAGTYHFNFKRKL
ncbi:glycoside hydrolase family 78 protein [Sphingobacterium sp. SRCM116780]|uniref:glycoside hydrolase family 78 protein n=1 Tax=Sphingobacterium sp. SRCM116780 TaxID=2907623 RepID=UPI001F22E0CE|nr:glycoside hydrolase family 78 protein [Sphingobacterium sp. SRCM116780]UIR57281.1 glycoside hydrolase family 78 protein [Sphingobacterium sp. SRCM116780]